ncbi:MAG: carboxypeptidase-like regulatory domain-containing protein [Planctomycetota bacterium]
MGSRLLLGLFVVAAIAAILWVALGGSDPAGVDPERSGPAARPDDDVAPPPVVPDEPVLVEEDVPGEPPEKMDGTGTLLVTVTDPEKRPVPGCVVTADGQTATTGADGIARFEELPAGKRITATATGPNSQDVRPSVRVVVIKDEETRTALVIRPGGGIRGVVRGPTGATLTVPFKITVRPTAVNGNWRIGQGRATVSRSYPAGDGRFEISRIRPGAYVVKATAEGFVEGSSETFRIEVGAFTEGVEITLSAGGSVVGVVVDRETGEPVAGATVGLADGENVVFVSSGGPGINFGGRHRATTDEKGAFRLENVPPGLYRVTAGAKGRTKASLDDIEVAAGVETGVLRLALGRGATITGTVYGPDGKPRAGRTVLIQKVMARIDFQGDYGQREKTDASGVYRAEGLEPGRYRVKLSANDGRSGFAIAFSGGSMGGEEEKPDDTPLGPDMVEVGEGQVVTRDLRVEARAVIRGTVKTRDGKVLKEMVRLQQVEEKKRDPARPRIEIPRMEHPDADGKFEFGGLEPGTWRVSCGDKRETVEVGPGDEVEVPFVLNPARVEGIVVDGSGRGIEGVTVQASRSQRIEDGPFFGGHVSPVRTGKDGRFTFPKVFAGTWTFRASKDGADGQTEEVEVAEGGHVRDVRIELVTLTDLTVKVVDAEGRPKQGIWVVANSRETNESKRGQTNAAGVATLQVRGGTEYRVMAFQEAVRGSASVKVESGVPAEIEITLK